MMQRQTPIALCMHCRVPLTHVEAERGLFVDFCRRCGLTWFDRGELGRLLGQSEDMPCAAEPESSSSAALACSRCNQISFHLWYVKNIEFYRCHICQSILISLRNVQIVRQILRQEQASKSVQQKLQLTTFTYSATFETPKLDLVAVPCTLFLAICFDYFRLTQFLAWYIGMIFHELGHGVAGWLSGYFALPTPFAVTFYGSNQSYIITLVVFAACFRGFIGAFTKKSRFFCAFFGATIIAQIYLTFFQTNVQARQLIIAGGFAGEMIFSGLLIGSYHLSIPYRWDFWRFLSIFLGMMVCSQSILRWIKVKLDLAPIPWGSALGGQDDGDLAQLRDTFSWTEANIVDFYFRIALCCLAFIGCSYFWFLLTRKQRV